MKTFDTVESIFQIFQSQEEVATRRESYSGKFGYLVAQVRALVGDTDNGAASARQFSADLNDLYKTQNIPANPANKLFLNRMINFYSTADDDGNSQDLFGKLKSPYLCETVEDKEKKYNKKASTLDIIGMSKDQNDPNYFPKDKHFSVVLLRNPLTSPAMYNVGKVESYLNFLPSIVLARCVPYVHVEFVFDRPVSSYGKLFTASTMKFLLGGDTIDTEKYDADSAIYKANNIKVNVDGKDRVYSRAGMDLFTAPQTLINMNPVSDRARYVDVLDPTRPFATLESLSINITGTTDTINFKTAQMTLKLHDRTRLAEFADLFQPGTAGGPGIAKCTVWLTYGMRHPRDPVAGGTVSAKTYGEFINNNMLVKEAFGVRNASYSFEGSGQVTITLQLDVKGGTDLMLTTLEDAHSNAFKKMYQDKKEVADYIAKLSKELHMERKPKDSDNAADSRGGESVEIRGYAVIEAAANNVYPEYKPAEVKQAIDGLKRTRASFDSTMLTKVDSLITKLEEYYEVKNGKFGRNDKRTDLVEEVVKKKFQELEVGLDPFLPNVEKHNLMMKEFYGHEGIPHPYIQEIEKYKNDERLTDYQVKGATKKVVSFGKLFSVFMAPALKKLEGIDEFQVFFYNINDLAGLASGTNLAEFPIDLPRFMRQYQDHLDANEAALLTVQTFVQLVIDSQLENLHAIPYGFRSKKELFEKWKKGKRGDEMTKEGSAQYPAYAVQVNNGRGTFLMPNIEILLETKQMRPNEGTSAGDLLSYFELEQGNLTKSSVAGYGKVLKIHIFDSAQNPHRGTEALYRGDKGSEYAWEFPKPFNPYAQQGQADALVVTEGQNGEKTVDGGAVREKIRNNSFDKETFTGDRTDRQKMMKLIARGIPMLIPGMEASGIKEASFASQADAAMQAAQMTGVGPSEDIQGTPRGDGVGNLPMRVIPSTMSMRTIGCPLLRFGQMYFIDMNTGTTIDNVYGLNSITHEFSQGKFESALEFVPYDAYGRYESAHEYNLDALNAQLRDVNEATPSSDPYLGPRQKRF